MGMLVLQRKVGQKVVVSDGVEVTVLEIEGARVRLGFLAPPELKVHRLEVWLRIQAEQERQRVEDAVTARRERVRARKRA